MNSQMINCFYEYFKDSPKKLKIVCDWDEVIQSLEPFALYLSLKEIEKMPQELENLASIKEFPRFFEFFWQNNQLVNYSSYGSQLTIKLPGQISKKNDPNFYNSAPFLSLAQELLMLVKEKKAEVIFLSAYDERIFSNGDPRKKKIFAETFGKLSRCSLNLVGFSGEKTGKTKSEWIRENVPNCDILLDDNPKILTETLEKNEKIIVCSPSYSAVKHHSKVLLIKTSISNLKKEDF